jgi:hypothetical protein
MFDRFGLALLVCVCAHDDLFPAGGGFLAG